MLQILGEKDDRHPAVAKLPLHAVSLAERRCKLLKEFHGPGLSAFERMCSALTGRARKRVCDAARRYPASMFEVAAIRQFTLSTLDEE